MKLSSEQYDIINSSGNIKINAVAGSGKTTTLIQYAMDKPRSNKILYLAFNKSVRLEAAAKFKTCGLDNVDVETAHSLAYKHIVPNAKYNVRSQGYKINELTQILELKGSGESNSEFIMANHINKFIAYFCNSDKSKLHDLNYLDVVPDTVAKAFVNKYYGYIETQARLFLAKMEKGEIDITHDFYLKMFQLSSPILKYDYILFDEGQDASAAMLDVFLNQKAIKVIVGDTNQQIYSWRYAVNSLEKTDFHPFLLSTSFRFSQNVANLAMEILKFKVHINNYKHIDITGKGNNKANKSTAVIARSNIGLLRNAIHQTTKKNSIKSLYFEGNINSYTYADGGTSLYDILNLYNLNHEMIKDQHLKSLGDIEELQSFIEQTGDVQLGMMVEIVNTYGNSIPKLINLLKYKHVRDEDKDKADIIFSTVHRSKGMEYDSIQIVEDFITEEKLINFKNEKNKSDYVIHKLNEEINLLYVAVTRTKKSIYIPDPLIPLHYKNSSGIGNTK